MNTNNPAWQFNQDDKIALIGEKGLGDALIYIVIANNLAKHHYNVTFFHNGLAEIANWFPKITIQPVPAPEQLKQHFTHFNKVIVTSHSVNVEPIHSLKHLTIYHFNRRRCRQQTMLETVVNGCRMNCGFTDVTKDNGIQAPAHLRKRKYSNRIVIHPLSTADDKNWTPKKFAQLNRKLKELNFDPVYIISKYERALWQQISPNDTYPKFNNLEEIASFIYESGWMIGNDSGIGHLASCLGIPSLTLCKRYGRSYFWQPKWAQNKMITPTIYLPRKLNHWWKYCLSVNKVKKEFLKMAKKYPKTSDVFG